MNEWKKKCVGLQRTWVSKRTVFPHTTAYDEKTHLPKRWTRPRRLPSFFSLTFLSQFHCLCGLLKPIDLMLTIINYHYELCMQVIRGKGSIKLSSILIPSVHSRWRVFLVFTRERDFQYRVTYRTLNLFCLLWPRSINLSFISVTHSHPILSNDSKIMKVMWERKS